MSLMLQKDGDKLRESRIRKEVRSISKRGIDRVVLLADPQVWTAHESVELVEMLEESFKGKVQFNFGLTNSSTEKHEAIYRWWYDFYSVSNFNNMAIVPMLEYSDVEYKWRSLMDSIISIPRAKGYQNQIWATYQLGDAKNPIERLDDAYVSYVFWPKDSTEFLQMKSWADLREAEVIWVNSALEWGEMLHDKSKGMVLLMSWNGIWTLKEQDLDWNPNKELD